MARLNEQIVVVYMCACLFWFMTMIYGLEWCSVIDDRKVIQCLGSHAQAHNTSKLFFFFFFKLPALPLWKASILCTF